MARIRTFKPDFNSDAKVARLSRDARLTFLLMFTEADDDGRLLGSVRRLAGVLYPNDDDVTPRKLNGWISQLVEQGMVQDYEVDGVRYLWIVNFAKHQKIDHRTDSRFPEPPPNGTRPPPDDFAKRSRTPSENGANDSLSDLGSGSRKLEGEMESSSSGSTGTANGSRQTEEEDWAMTEARQRLRRRTGPGVNDIEAWLDHTAVRLRTAYPNGLPKPTALTIVNCPNAECVNGWIEVGRHVDPCPDCHPKAAVS